MPIVCNCTFQLSDFRMNYVDFLVAALVSSGCVGAYIKSLNDGLLLLLQTLVSSLCAICIDEMPE